MLALLVLVLGGSALVLSRLSSGARVDLSKLNMNVLNLQDGTPGNQAAATGGAQAPAAEPQAPGSASGAEKREKAADTPAPQAQAAGFTLTIGGSVALTDEVRKNSQGTDSKTCDYSDVMVLLAPRLRGDLNVVFLENILSDSFKASNTVAPEAAADLLNEAGFGIAACGFSKAYDKGSDGIETTIMTLLERNIIPVGIRAGDEQDELGIRNVNGIRTAILQYTATVSSRTRRTMEKEGASRTVPEAETGLISSEIATARAQGAEAVIVLVNWGKTGKDPDRSQRELAQSIADAGADLIVGNGSLVPQTAEYLTGRDGRAVLCVWSLGSLLSGDRSNVRRMSGYLLHVTVRGNGKGGVDVLNPEYTPVYTWKYKQDGRFYYRCIASDAPAPDGMDSEQKKNMERSEEAVEKALGSSPVSHRETE